MTATAAPDHIVITRMIDAPPTMVFRAWLEPAHIQRWYSAGNGWTTPFAESDPRPGGAFAIGFGSPDGQHSFTFSGVYDVVLAPKRLAFTMADGRPASVDLTEELGGKTRIAVTLGLESTHSAEQQREGWTAIVDNLARHLAINRTVVFERTYDATLPAAFAAWAESELLAQWWGPGGFTNPVCEADARPGGALKIVMRAPDGAEYPMSGTFRDVAPPLRLAFTNTAHEEGESPKLLGFTTVDFRPDGTGTRIRVESEAVGMVPEAVQMLEGMEAGWSQSLDRLGALLAKA